MLLFTWTSLMTKTGHLFQWTFEQMNHGKWNVNILFIIIGIIGAIYWLTQQTKYNAEAEKNGTVK
jgi:membrane protein DedA with SNARE-associated domain